MSKAIPDSTFRLKWRRTYPDDDPHFHAIDAKLEGHWVIQVSRNKDSTGALTTWHSVSDNADSR